jgi:7-carboxy-7-deazaguanine synthase
LITAVKDRGFENAIETNGTMLAPTGIDWICVSPKAGTNLVQRSGDELKLVYPQSAALPEAFDFSICFCSPWMARTVSATRSLPLRIVLRIRVGA